jgi:hypothetical protein
MGFCCGPDGSVIPLGAGLAGDEVAAVGPVVDPVEAKFVAERGVGATDFVKGLTFWELPIAVGQGKVLAASPPIRFSLFCNSKGKMFFIRLLRAFPVASCPLQGCEESRSEPRYRRSVCDRRP